MLLTARRKDVVNRALIVLSVFLSVSKISPELWMNFREIVGIQRRNIHLDFTVD